jgi:hypothetical protein
MIDVPVPTRAEVADCADVVRQQADALMLSGETAAGKYPIKAVQTLQAVCSSRAYNFRYSFFGCLFRWRRRIGGLCDSKLTLFGFVFRPIRGDFATLHVKVIDSACDYHGIPYGFWLQLQWKPRWIYPEVSALKNEML